MGCVSRKWHGVIRVAPILVLLGCAGLMAPAYSSQQSVGETQISNVADQLLATDQSRNLVVDRIVRNWGEALEKSEVGLNAAQLGTLLHGLRTDHLLAASLAASLEGLRNALSSALASSGGSAAATTQGNAPRDQGKALVDASHTPAVAPAGNVLSDRELKDHVMPIDGRKILARVVALPLATWSYRGQTDNVRHMGPMAQDFRAAFGLGEGETHIATLDADGVALAAIQGLHAVVKDQNEEIALLRSELTALRAEQQATLNQLRALKTQLEAENDEISPTSDFAFAPSMKGATQVSVWRKP